MATYFVLRVVRFGSTTLLPGSVVSDDEHDIRQICAVAGVDVLWPAPDPIVDGPAGAARMTRNCRRAEQIMREAVEASREHAEAPRRAARQRRLSTRVHAAE